MMCSKTVASALAAAAGVALTITPASADLQPTFLQLFEMEWDDIERRLPDIFLVGYNALWLPPPSRASDPFSVGFDVFDRFDLGQPPLLTSSVGRARTAYGTEATLRSMTEAADRAGVLVYFDAVLNHNSGRTTSDAFFADGGWPGFFVPRSPNGFGGFRDKAPTDDWGDFHAGVSGGFLQSENPGAPRFDSVRGDLVALVDIDQLDPTEFIRQPVAPGVLMNIPSGTVRNVLDPQNARFYPDLSLPPMVINNPRRGTVLRYPFNLADPMAGDPVPETNAEYLGRWIQWMIEVNGADGFRLDASRHAFSQFWDREFDEAMHLARVLPDGTRVTPFSFGENTISNGEILSSYFRRDGFADRDALDLSGAGDLRNLINSGGFGSWQNVLNSHLDFTDDGFQNGSAGVFHVFSHDNGSLGDGGSRPVLPTMRQEGLFVNAYTLLRPGVGLVYHNGRGVPRSSGFFPREGNATALGWDPVAQQPNDAFPTLVRIRNQYAYGQFFQLNSTINDVLVFERNIDTGTSAGRIADMVVGLSDRYDSGFDTVNVNTRFTSGTRLMEVTGNAANPAVDPTNAIPEFITVGANGFVSLRVPRNVSSSGEHNRGYVVYAPPVPGGTLTVVGTSGEVPADPVSTPDFVQRLNALPIVSGESFTIRLETLAQDATDNTSDDNALFRFNDGFGDLNGNGRPDIAPGTPVVGGFEEFTTLRQPGSNASDRRGLYEQVISTAELPEGNNYLTVIAFRPRPQGTTPLFAEFREVIYVDREPAGFTVDLAGQVVEAGPRELRVLADDATLDRVFLFANLADGVDPVALTNTATALRIFDARDWRTTVNNLQPGANTLTVVGFEGSGRSVVREFTVFVGSASCNPADLSDTPPGSGSFGQLDGNDIGAFVSAFLGADAPADLSDTPPGSGTFGQFDGNDIGAFVSNFLAGCP